jgi:hypothetical protein
MEQKITKNDLIRYIYKETSISETLAINEALRSRPELHVKYQELLQGYQQLPKAKFNPSASAIQNILRYSQRTALEAHS